MSRKTLIIVGLVVLAGLFFFIGARVVPHVTEKLRIDALESATKAKYLTLLNQLKAEGIEMQTDVTKRTQAQQDAEIAEGDTSANQTFSWHQLGRAIDAYPKVNGKADYKATNLAQYRTYHKKAEALGFRSLAFNADGTKRMLTNSKGQKFWDGGHIEWRAPYDSLAQAKAAEYRGIA